MDRDDSQLIASCQNGTMEDFSFLYDKYIKKIYDFIYYKVQHTQTAEDLTSQAFLKALDKIGSFRIDKGTFQAWLYQIARNTVIDHYRTKKTNANIEDIWDLASDDDIERDIDTRDKLKEVDAYLAKLKSEHRDILVMRIWQDMSYAEIAEALGKSEDSCKMQFSRTIRKLREEMPLAAFVSMLLLNI